jgi:hypothetical protein
LLGRIDRAFRHVLEQVEGIPKFSPAFYAERSIKCHKGMCITVAHYCAGSRPVRDMDRV